MLGLVFVTVAWGAGFSAVKIGLCYLPPFQYVGIRFSVAALLIAGYMVNRGVPLRFRPQLWPQMVALIVLFYGQQSLTFVGLTYTHASRTGVILNVHPLITALLAHYLVANDRLTVPKAAGMLLALGGVYAIFRDRMGNVDPTILSGDTLILGAAACWSIQTVIVKRTAGRVAASTIVVWQAAVSSLLFFATSAAFETPSPPVLDARFYLATAYLVVIATALAFVLWNLLIQINPPSKATAFCFITPASSVVFGALMLGEPLTRGVITGCAMVGAGLIVSNAKRASQDAGPQT